MSGEVAVTGKKLDSNTKITVKINGTSAGDPVSAQEENGKFTFKKNVLEPIVESTTVQADQTPAVADSTNTTGPVQVEKAQSARDKITVDQPSLDFGHQAMQTASDSKPVVVTNKSGAALTFQLLTALGQPKDFKVSGCQNAVENNDHCTFNVAFAPFPSNHSKLRENFIALVPTSERDAFERLRRDLNDKQYAADKAEDQWRSDMRCKDHNRECPDDLRNAAKAKRAEEADKQRLAYLSQRDEEKQALEKLHAGFHLVDPNAVADHWKFPFTRAVVGLDMSAPTSRTIKQSYFIDFDLLAPFKFPGLRKNLEPLENRFFFWLNPRITSLPQATNFSTVSTIDQTGSFFDTNQKLDKLLNGLDVSGGLDFALVKPRDRIPWFAEYANTQAKLTPSLIIGAGMSTPFATDSTQVTSTVTRAICDAFAAPAGQQISVGTPQTGKGAQQGLHCQFQGSNTSPSIVGSNNTFYSNIQFYEQDRSRFFRRYYAGLRLKIYFFSQEVHSYCQPFESRHLDEGDCAAP